MIVRNLVFTTLQKGFNFPFMKFALLNNMTYKTLLWSQILQTLFSWFQTYFNKRLKTFKTLNNDTLNIIRLYIYPYEFSSNTHVYYSIEFHFCFHQQNVALYIPKSRISYHAFFSLVLCRS